MAKIRTEQENRIFIETRKKKQQRRQQSIKHNKAANKISANPTQSQKQKLQNNKRYEKFKVVHPEHKKRRTKVSTVHNDKEDVVEPHE